MKKADKTYIKSIAKILTQSDLSIEYVIEELKVIYLMGKTAESKERLEEFRKTNR